MQKLTLILVLFVLAAGCTAEKIEVGQVWKYESENPFNKFSYTATITEVKGGYLKYKKNYNWESPDSTRTDSAHIKIFKMLDMKLIKDVE